MKNMKFRVRNEQHSEEIQDALFAKGYKWCYSNRYCNTEARFLFTYNNGNLTHDLCEQHFDDHQNREHVVFGGVIYSVDEMAGVGTSSIGLRPKHIAEGQRKWEILCAITRYVEDAKKVPQEWLEEFSELNGRMK